jgi:ABC-type multidrug transport system ATPase subunit
MIRVRNLAKRFGRVVALEGVGFDVGAGESVALWGENGAGKTTALRCLLGVMPFEGDVSINGFDVKRRGKDACRQVGFVPQDIRFHDNLRVEETLSLFARIRRAERDEIPEVVEQMGLQAYVDKRVKVLSGGVRQRLALAVSLLARPPILFLDEPTANLDAQSRKHFISFLQAQKEEGRTILYCSHRIEEIHALAERVLLLEQGRLVADCTPGELQKRLGVTAFLRVYLERDLVDRAIEVLTEHGIEASRNGAGVKVRVQADKKALPLNALSQAGVVVSDFDYVTGRSEEGLNGDH